MTTPAMTGKDRAMPNNSDQAAMHDELRAIVSEMRATNEAVPLDLKWWADRLAALSMPASEAVDAPDDATSLEVVEHFLHVARTMKPVGQWPGERLCVAIERLISGPRNFIAEADKSPYRASSRSTSRG